MRERLVVRTAPEEREMEIAGTAEPEAIKFDAWADEGQVAYYEHGDDRIAEEVVAWGTAADGARVPLSWNVYGDEDALEILTEKQGEFLLVGFGNIHVDGQGGLIAVVQRARPTGSAPA